MSKLAAGIQVKDADPSDFANLVRILISPSILSVCCDKSRIYIPPIYFFDGFGFFLVCQSLKGAIFTSLGPLNVTKKISNYNGASLLSDFMG